MEPFASPRVVRALLVAAAVLTALAVGVVGVIVIVTPHAPRERAVVAMGAGLVAIWCCAGGALQRRHLPALVRFLRRVPGPPSMRFVFGCTALALLEEAVSTAMTNTAPLLGVTVAEAHITPSTSWLHTVALHSVVVFVPMFTTWALLLSRRRFHPAEVMLLVGVNGLVAEAFTFGQLNPMWIFIYGLMAWAPAHALDAELERSAFAGAFRARARPGPFAYALACVAPVVAAVPVALAALALHPSGLVDLK